MIKIAIYALNRVERGSLMASMGVKFKNLPIKKKACLLGLISFFLLALVFGIKLTYAYYYNESSIGILANLIGDFDIGDGDINMMIYKENDQGVFEKTYAIPSIGYVYNKKLTTCTIPCGTNSTSSCYYEYNSTNKLFSLTSDQKVTCKFYFEQESNSDINVYIMKEDSSGTHTYNSNNYLLIENIPAYGYEYVGYYCENPVENLSYNSETKKFSVSTATKNTCYAYFNSTGNVDIVTNVYVQSKEGSAVYNKVDYIPANNTYVKSENKKSWCYDASGNDMNSTISYTDGYIYITASGKQTCDVYLDLSTN